MTDEPTSNNIVRFTGLTKLDLTPDVILSDAADKLESVIVIGTTKTGDQYFSSSSSDAKDIMWHIETAKYMLMETIFYPEEE